MTSTNAHLILFAFFAATASVVVMLWPLIRDGAVEMVRRHRQRKQRAEQAEWWI